jgi:hypothetical protein
MEIASIALTRDGTDIEIEGSGSLPRCQFVRNISSLVYNFAIIIICKSEVS